MEKEEAIKIIVEFFERYGFTIEYDSEFWDDGRGKWTILFAPRDENLVEIAQRIKDGELAG